MFLRMVGEYGHCIPLCRLPQIMCKSKSVKADLKNSNNEE